jgi:hypothetical protein
MFPRLEDQQCAFAADLDRKVAGSPDRVDALVWSLTHMIIDNVAGAGLMRWYENENRKQGKLVLDGDDTGLPPSPDSKPKVNMRAPQSWCGTVYGSTGKTYFPVPGEVLEVLEDDAPPLRRLGFVEEK